MRSVAHACGCFTASRVSHAQQFLFFEFSESKKKKVDSIRNAVQIYLDYVTVRKLLARHFHVSLAFDSLSMLCRRELVAFALPKLIFPH